MEVSSEMGIDSAATKETLKNLYKKINFEQSADRQGLHLFVSDVIVIHDNGKDTAYFCNDVGFKEVPEFFQSENHIALGASGIAIDGHIGTWHTIDSQKIDGKDYFLMEHEKYGDEVACVIVDSTGKVAAEDVWNGFDKETTEMLLTEQILEKSSSVPIQGKDAIDDMETSPEKRNYLKAAEEYSEENYNEVDGRMETESKQDPGDSIGDGAQAKSSVLKKLQEKKASIAQQEKLSPDRAFEKPLKNKDAELA